MGGLSKSYPFLGANAPPSGGEPSSQHPWWWVGNSASENIQRDSRGPGNFGGIPLPKKKTKKKRANYDKLKLFSFPGWTQKGKDEILMIFHYPWTKRSLERIVRAKMSETNPYPNQMIPCQSCNLHQCNVNSFRFLFPKTWGERLKTPKVLFVAHLLHILVS